jgi:hypothetical protein
MDDMKRRAFITLLGGAAEAPIAPWPRRRGDRMNLVAGMSEAKSGNRLPAYCCAHAGYELRRRDEVIE